MTETTDTPYTADRRERERLLAEATPRPWEVVVDKALGCAIDHRPHGTAECRYVTPSPPDRWMVEDITAGGTHVVCTGHNYDDYGHVEIADAALIVAAVNDYERLLRVEEAARAYMAKYAVANTSGYSHQRRREAAAALRAALDERGAGEG